MVMFLVGIVIGMLLTMFLFMVWVVVKESKDDGGFDRDEDDDWKT